MTSTVRVACMCLFACLAFALPSASDEAVDEASARISQALGVEVGDVQLAEPRTSAHLECYPFSATCEGYRVNGLYAKALEQIVEARFDYDEDFEPDPRWAALQPNEAMTAHLRSLDMALPQGVRLAKQKTLPMGDWGDRVSLLYERVEGELAPLWLAADLNAADHRPYSMTSIDYPLEVDTTPGVPEQSAIAAARRAAGVGAGQACHTRLRVWFGDDHTQVLWWDVTFTGKTETDLMANVTINARSGEVVRKVTYEGGAR